jgi:CheY-like chemotaxis protein
MEHNGAVRVLVVDDDGPIREAFRGLLEDAGYAVSEAADGHTALEVLRHSPHRLVVLLDLRMPGMDGGAVLGAVAADRDLVRRHAIILVTADHRTFTLPFANLLSTLSVPLLRKPTDADDLLGTVSEAACRLGAD